MKKLESIKYIPIKNYGIYILIVIATIFLVFYVTKWYNTNKEYRENNSVIATILFEARSNDIDSYLLENPTTVIYTSSSKDNYIKVFEDQFKNYIKDNNLSKQIIYLDMSKIDDGQFYKKFVKTYFPNNMYVNNISSNTNLIFIKDGKVVDILSKQSSRFKIEDTKNMFAKHELTIND